MKWKQDANNLRKQDRGPNWPFDVEKLQIGDKCQFRFNAYPEWYNGEVVENGMHLTWTVRALETRQHAVKGKLVTGIYIEHIRMPQGESK